MDCPAITTIDIDRKLMSVPELDHRELVSEGQTLDFILRAFGSHENILSKRETQSPGTLVLSVSQTSVFL